MTRLSGQTALLAAATLASGLYAWGLGGLFMTGAVLFMALACALDPRAVWFLAP